MIVQCIRNTYKIKSLTKIIAQYSSAIQEKWDIQAAVCLERKPVITPNLTHIENDFKNVLSEIEIEQSVKSDFEIRHETDLKQLEMLKKGEETDSEINLKQTAQDLLDLWTEELAKFKPSHRITDADKKNQLNTLNQKLDKHLILVVNKNDFHKKFHGLPVDFWRKGETLRQSAERVLKNHCGDDIAAQIYGNAPCGFYKYKYPLDVRNKSGVQGAKVFVFFARYLKGAIVQKDLDYKWLDRNELEKVMHPICYTAVSQFLIND